jgi:hypothetical protein
MSDPEDGKAPTPVLRLIPGAGRRRKERTKRSYHDGATCDELLGLGNIVGALAVADFAGYDAQDGLAFVAERLRALAGADDKLLTEFFE